jgi:hypothetical protein
MAYFAYFGFYPVLIGVSNPVASRMPPPGFEPSEDGRLASLGAATSWIQITVWRALVNRWIASASTVRTSGMKRETADVHVEDLPLHKESGSVS